MSRVEPQPHPLRRADAAEAIRWKSRPPSPRRAATLRLLLLAAVTCAGACRTPPPDAASNHQMPGDLPGSTTVLDEHSAAAIHETLRSVPPEDFQPLLAPPLGERRWSDLQSAVIAALSANNAAMLRRNANGDLEQYTFKTTDGRQGTMTVKRVPPPQVASASVTMHSVAAADDLERSIEEALQSSLDAHAQRRKVEDLRAATDPPASVVTSPTQPAPAPAALPR